MSNARRGRKPTFRAHVDAWLTHRYWHNRRITKANPKEPPGVPTTPARGLARAHPLPVQEPHHSTPGPTTSQGMQDVVEVQPGDGSGVKQSCGGVEGHALAGSRLAGMPDADSRAYSTSGATRSEQAGVETGPQDAGGE